MNAAQLLAKLDACAVDGSLAADCRRVLGEQALVLRARVNKLEERERWEAAARLRGTSRAGLEDYADETRQARERLGSAIQEAQRVMALWGVLPARRWTIEGLVDGMWCREHVGANDANAFDTREQAEAELPALAAALACDVSELRAVEMKGGGL